MTSPKSDRPQPRKQPKQVRSSQTVAIIVEAAARILETMGHAAFTTNAVASRAGVSIGTLYQYFPNKEAILGALLARETAQLLASAKGALLQPVAEEALSDLIWAAVEHQFKRPRLAMILDIEEARMPPGDIGQSVSVDVTQIASVILERLEAPGNLNNMIAARDVIAMIKGMVDTAGLHGEIDPMQVMSRVRRAVTGYLGIAGEKTR
jgi:AcrR family transcriptional regulator